MKLAPPASGAYLSACFSPTNNEIAVATQTIDDFEALAQRPVAIVVFSNHWDTKGRVDMHFPAHDGQTLSALRIPL